MSGDVGSTENFEEVWGCKGNEGDCGHEEACGGGCSREENDCDGVGEVDINK